jgi:8-oxo-dGTP diphosphatase
MNNEIHFDGKVAQKAVIQRSGQVLVMRDPREGNTALWELPGGRLNENEDPKVGLTREIREELGVEIVVGDVVYITQFFQYSENRNALMIAYEAKLQNETTELTLAPDEVAEVRWVNREDYNTLTYFKEYKDTLDRYFS